MASPTRWIWVWVDSGSWWWTGRPGVLRFMGSQGVRHNWVTELTDSCAIWKQSTQPKAPQEHKLSASYLLFSKTNKQTKSPLSISQNKARFYLTSDHVIRGEGSDRWQSKWKVEPGSCSRNCMCFWDEDTIYNYLPSGFHFLRMTQGSQCLCISHFVSLSHILVCVQL